MAREYERAFMIYEKELAPLGDKYAQYMVGYMYLNAQSVLQDKISALAWFRIAAERGERCFPALRPQCAGKQRSSLRSWAARTRWRR